MNWKVTLSLFLVFQIYLIIGMVVFHFLEKENEDDNRRDTEGLKDEILANFTCLASEDVDAIIAALSNAINNGIDPSSNTTSRSKWEYGSAYFFSGTVVTTIGYGHITPSTSTGQSFCVVYALIGIPICFILLSALGEGFNQFKDYLLENIYKRFQKKWQRKTFSLLLIFGFGLLLFVFVPAVIFQVIEGWTYNEALYYCFITLTTVGLGDFVVGQNPDINYPAIYEVMALYWIILGLVFLSIIIQDISDAMSSEVGKQLEKEEEKQELTGKGPETDYGGFIEANRPEGKD